MEKYIQELKENNYFFALFNKDNFANFYIYDALFFNYEEFKILSYFFYDFYDFDFSNINEGDEYFIQLNENIKNIINYEYCGFYPILNCKYKNIKEREYSQKIKDEIINKIITIQKNRFLPNNENKKIICFHNGDGEFRDGIPLNPIIFDVHDISILRKFCLSFFNYNLDTCFHGKQDVCFDYLDERMKSFFRRRIISSNYKKDILYSNKDFEKLCLSEKEELLKIIKLKNL